MKKIRYIYLLLIACAFSACNDSFLERYPLSQLAPQTFFETSKQLEVYTNAFYNTLPVALDLYYTAPWYGDDDVRTNVPDEFRGTRIVPNTGGGWTWSELRRINYFLENSSKCPDAAAVKKYNGVARFFRAYFYLDKIQRFGDVPWYENTLDTDSEDLYKGRDSRKFVFAKMLEDIDYAIANVGTTKSGQLISKWTALALKSRMCLFEGTFRKYHGLDGWEDILKQCAEASADLMKNSGYDIYTSTPTTAYQELFVQDEPLVKEMILARQYNSSIPFVHSTNFYTNGVSFGRPGVQRSVINSYLMKDGSRFTDIPGYETMQFYEETQNRDPRLAQTIRTPGYKRMGENTTLVPDFASCITGYQYIKYVTGTKYDNGNDPTDLPLFRFAEVLLNYAEAKAELNTLSQADIDISIKKLRDRVDMPNMDMAKANANPDPFLLSEYPNVSQGTNTGVILEIRRERRIELIREGHRWEDLLRWKEGARLNRKFYGMYFPGIGQYDLDKDGTIDLEIYTGTKPTVVKGRQYQKLGELDLENGLAGGQILLNRSIVKEWDEKRDYFYPIPTQERQLNPNLKQNPYWKDDSDK